jgi:hypothetical protein
MRTRRIVREAIIRHGDEEPAVAGLSDLVDRCHVRVIERGRRARLGEKAGVAPRIGAKIAGEELERNVPIEASVVREIHASHAPAPYLAE